MTSLADEVLARHHSVHDYGDRWFCPGCDGLRPETGCDAARAAEALAAAQATLDTVAAERDALRLIVEAAREVDDPMVRDGGGDRWWAAHDRLHAALAAASPAEKAT